MKLCVVPIVLLAVQVTAFAQSNSKCADMAKFRSPGVTLEITRAEIVPAGRAPGARGGPAGPELPAHCRIDGMMDRRTGTDGKTYGIRFAAWHCGIRTALPVRSSISTSDRIGRRPEGDSHAPVTRGRVAFGSVAHRNHGILCRRASCDDGGHSLRCR
jgi:hypothetical protein